MNDSMLDRASRPLALRRLGVSTQKAQDAQDAQKEAEKLPFLLCAFCAFCGQAVRPLNLDFSRVMKSLRDRNDPRLREFFQAFLSHLAAEAGLFRAAERTFGWNIEMFVHPHRAGCELRCKLEGAFWIR